MFDVFEVVELCYCYIFEYVFEGIFQLICDGCYLVVNLVLVRFYGYDSVQVLIVDFVDIDCCFYVCFDCWDDFFCLIELVGEVLNFELEVYWCDGLCIWIFENVYIVYGLKGEFICYEGIVQDIFECKWIEVYLELLVMVFLNSNEVIIVIDVNNWIVVINLVFIQFIGYWLEEVMGRNLCIFLVGIMFLEVFWDMWVSFYCDGVWQGELWDCWKIGEFYFKWLLILLVCDELGKVCNYIGSFIDILEFKVIQECICYFVYYDMLINLFNCFSFNEKFGQVLVFCKCNDMQLVLMLIDFDCFKMINDMFGYQVGDVLLV